MDIFKLLKEAIETHQALRLSVESIKSEFNERQRAMDNIERDIKSILQCKLSTVDIIDEVENLDVTDLSDDKYIAKLQKIYGKYSYEEKLSSIISIIEKLVAYSDRLKVKSSKLSSRIKLSDENTEEVKNARRLKHSVDESLLAISNRVGRLVDMFFNYRKAMLNYIMGNTERLVGIFTSDGIVSPVMKEYYNKKIKAERFHLDNEAMNSKMKVR